MALDTLPIFQSLLCCLDLISFLDFSYIYGDELLKLCRLIMYTCIYIWQTHVYVSMFCLAWVMTGGLSCPSFIPIASTLHLLCGTIIQPMMLMSIRRIQSLITNKDNMSSKVVGSRNVLSGS